MIGKVLAVQDNGRAVDVQWLVPAEQAEVMQLTGQLTQQHGLRTDFLRQFFTARRGAVGNDHLRRMLGRKMGGDQIDHFAGAHEQHPAIGQCFENAARQSDRGRSHRHRVGPQGRA